MNPANGRKRRSSLANSLFLRRSRARPTGWRCNGRKRSAAAAGSRILPRRFDTPQYPCKIQVVVLPENRVTRYIAIVAELADAHGSGPCTRKGVGVRVPSMAPAAEDLGSSPCLGFCTRL